MGMKRNRIFIVLGGFIATILLFALVTVKLAYWEQLRWYFVIILFLTYVHHGINQRMNPRIMSIATICGTSFAAVFSGIFAGVAGLDVVWLMIAGIAVSILAAMAQYFAVRASRGSDKNHGFTFTQEIALTVFACTVYPVMVLLPVGCTGIVGYSIVAALIAGLVALVLSSVYKRNIRDFTWKIENWRDHDTLPHAAVSLLMPVEHALGVVITQVKDSAASLQHMGSEIKTSSEDLSSVSEQMNASLEEVSSTIQQISKGAQDQSASITTIAHAIEHLNSLTTSISSQVKMASVSSRRTATSAQQGMGLSKHEATLSREIFEQTKFSEEKMVRLRDQATEIKKILDIIGGITEQTDLLALNAAIEAARVGEQGKGFAVVADEIRNLANETQRSSSIVESLILEINNTIQELNDLLTLEREKMTESKELAIQTEEQFTGIAKAVDLITDMISRINDAASNQSSNTKELVKQVEQIAQVAADTAAATEEVSASVQEQTASMQEFTSTAQLLAEFAMKLAELISKFR
jgi:methyl-accepting chemotaxis protein